MGKRTQKEAMHLILFFLEISFENNKHAKMVGYRLCRKMLPLACRSAIFFARSDNIDKNGGKNIFLFHTTLIITQCKENTFEIAKLRKTFMLWLRFLFIVSLVKPSCKTHVCQADSLFIKKAQ